MKKLVHCMAAAAMLASCQTDFRESETVRAQEPAANGRAEEAMPGVPKETVVLPSGIRLERAGDTYIYQGDIVLSSEQVELLGTPATRGAASTDFVRHWHLGNIPYFISPSLPNADRVTKAIARWESDTRLTFPRLTSASGDCIRFVRGAGNSSYIGKAGGVQDIEVSDSASVGVIMHEIGHAVGLFHEHARADRDKYVRIIWPNVRPGKESAFDKYTDMACTGADIGDFDFGLLMMFDSRAYSRTAGYTIVKTDGSSFTAQRTGLSSGNRQAVSYIYGSPFVKLETKLKFGIHGTDNLYVRYEYTNTLRFYGDPEMTTPVGSAIPRHVSLKYTSFVGGTTSVKYITVETPPFTDSYELSGTWVEQSRTSTDLPYTTDESHTYEIVGAGR